MKKTFFLSLFALLAVVACGDEDNPTANTETIGIYLSQAKLEADAKGGAFTISLSNEKACQAVVLSGEDWIKLSAKDFAAAQNHQVTITVAENPKTSARTGSVKFWINSKSSQTLTIVQHGAGESAIKCPLEGYELVWNDEFNGERLNASDWMREVWPAGRVNNELQAYVNSDETAYVEDGVLKLRCYRDTDGSIKSARLYAHRYAGWKYGYFEARLKMPPGRGTWPAFWMMPIETIKGWPHDGEIDIMENVGYQPHRIFSTIHCTRYNNGGSAIEHGHIDIPTAETEFHTYALEWTADYQKYYVDGKLVLNYRNDGKNNNDTWPFNRPFYIILNNAFGGDWGGAQGIDEQSLPSIFEVDYVRVFQK